MNDMKTKGTDGVHARSFRLKRPPVIAAVRFNLQSPFIKNIEAWCKGSCVDDGMWLLTRVGDVKAADGDWIAKVNDREFEVFSDRMFTALYEEIPDEIGVVEQYGNACSYENEHGTTFL